MMIGIDTSGSVGTDDFKEFMAEIRGIMQTYKNETTIIESDAQVQKTYKLKPNQQLDTKFKGRGGTDYEPVFKYLKEKEKDVDLLIYFTDFYCSFPKEKPKFPVLWVVTSQGDKDNKPPWGMTIRIKKASKYGEEEEE
jgi:predicted metal-dependent peptidase